MDDFLNNPFEGQTMFDLPDPTAEDVFPVTESDGKPLVNADIPAGDLACKECGAPLEYAGRGRKPMYCDEHKKGGGKSSTSPRSPAKRNDALAEEAAEVLSQINGLLGLGLLLAPAPFKMPETAATLEAKGDAFKAAAADALKANPTLARSIARAGGVSGSAGLVIAYGVLAASVAPVAVKEFQSNRAQIQSKEK